MKSAKKPNLLEESLSLLIRHFGEEKVFAALKRVSSPDLLEQSPNTKKPSPQKKNIYPLTTTELLEELKGSDVKKYETLTDFYRQLTKKYILPETQDIKIFVEQMGIKQIRGKSRREMITNLMEILLNLPSNELQQLAESAGKISEHQRSQGFSLLADKIIGQK